MPELRAFLVCARPNFGHVQTVPSAIQPTEAEAFNALCRLIGERFATAETEDNEISARAYLAQLKADAAANGEPVKSLADRLFPV